MVTENAKNTENKLPMNLEYSYKTEYVGEPYPVYDCLHCGSLEHGGEDHDKFVNDRCYKNIKIVAGLLIAVIVLLTYLTISGLV